jgi:hypothetical protein
MKGSTNHAIFYHFIFIITSPSLYEFDFNIETFQSYNYAKLKLFSQLSFSLCLSILIFVISFIKHPQILKNTKKSIFYKLYKFVFIIGLIGTLFGIFGLVFLNYYLDGFIGYFSYIFTIFINISILIYNYSDSLINKFYHNSIILLAAAPIASMLIYIAGFTRIVYFYDSFYTIELGSFFSIILLAGLLYEKKIGILLLGFICSFIISMSHTGGKGIFFFIFILIACLFLSNDKHIKQVYKFRTRMFQIGICIFIAFFSSFLLYIYSNDKYILLQNKIYQFTSMINGVYSNDMNSISASPYVRIASLKNIMYEHMQNPITLIFGDGYGGYYEDHFGFFNRLESLKSAFSDKSVLEGKYYYAHDTLVTVPFLNGLLGLFLLSYVVFNYIKSTKINFLSLACLPFLLLAFYYNTQIGIAGIMLLFSSEYRMYNK